MTNYFAFMDESGVLDESKQKQPFFAVGALIINDTSQITEELCKKHYDFFSSQKEKRKTLLKELDVNPRVLSRQDLNLLLSSTRHYEYKFTNITHLTLERYKSFIETLFKYSVKFCALVIDKTDKLFDSTIYRNYWVAYIKYAKLLAAKNCAAQDSLCVIADYMNKPRESYEYFESELNKLPNVVNTLRAHSETFTLLQACDLLLGSVLFQWRQKGNFITESNRAEAKKDFVNFLISKMIIPTSKLCDYPLAQAITINRPFYFSVWPLKLSKKT